MLRGTYVSLFLKMASSKNTHPKKFASHDENLYKICLLCCRKCNGQKLTDNLKTKLLQVKAPTLSFEDERMPKVICTSCRLMLPNIQAGKRSVTDLPSFDFSKISLKSKTRGTDPSSVPCTCMICDIARDTTPKPKANVGRPRSESSVIQSPMGKGCSKCLTKIAKGIKHDCSEKSLLNNMQTLSEKHPRTSEIFVSSQIQKKAEEQKSDTVSLATKGLPCTVTSKNSKAYVPRALFPDKPIPSSEINKIQVACNLSNAQTSKVCSMMKSFKGRDSIESHIDQKLIERDRKLEKYFEHRKILVDVPVPNKKSEMRKEERNAVVCNDVDAFVKCIIHERNLNCNETSIKLGLDGGKGSLKVTLNLTTKEKDNLNSPLKKSTRYSYAQGIQSRSFQDTGVKKLFILAIVEEVKETYENLKALLDELELEKIEHFSTLDLKCLNIICGLENPASASFPCPYCDTAKKEFNSIADSEISLRTVGSLERNYENLRLESLNSKTKRTISAQKFKNVRRKHLIKAPADILILDLFPPPELHLLLGSVNNLYDHLDKTLISIKSPMKLIDWAKSLNVHHSKYNSGDFEGNQCNKLLYNLDELQRRIENAGFETIVKAMPYLEAFRNLKLLKESCFGQNLDPNYKVTIQNFKRSCLALGISITLKMHIIFSHVDTFCSQRKVGLGMYSEQATESCHSDFHRHRQNFKLPVRNHDEYPDTFLKCVVAYNSRHL